MPGHDPLLEQSGILDPTRTHGEEPVEKKKINFGGKVKKCRRKTKHTANVSISSCLTSLNHSEKQTLEF